MFVSVSVCLCACVRVWGVSNGHGCKLLLTVGWLGVKKKQNQGMHQKS